MSNGQINNRVFIHDILNIEPGDINLSSVNTLNFASKPMAFRVKYTVMPYNKNPYEVFKFYFESLFYSAQVNGCPYILNFEYNDNVKNLIITFLKHMGCMAPESILTQQYLHFQQHGLAVLLNPDDYKYNVCSDEPNIEEMLKQARFNAIKLNSLIQAVCIKYQAICNIAQALEQDKNCIQKFYNLGLMMLLEYNKYSIPAFNSQHTLELVQALETIYSLGDAKAIDYNNDLLEIKLVPMMVSGNTYAFLYICMYYINFLMDEYLTQVSVNNKSKQELQTIISAVQELTHLSKNIENKLTQNVNFNILQNFQKADINIDKYLQIIHKLTDTEAQENQIDILTKQKIKLVDKNIQAQTAIKKMIKFKNSFVKLDVFINILFSIAISIALLILFFLLFKSYRVQQNTEKSIKQPTPLKIRV